MPWFGTAIFTAIKSKKENPMLKERLMAMKEMPIEELRGFSEPQRRRLVNDMLANIGSTDGELRDGLIYSTFFRLIMENVFTEDELIFILDVCQDEDHLFHKINGHSEDAVFTRSFSSLVIALVLHQDKTRKFLPADMVGHVFMRSVEYMHREQDTRALVEGKGWAHSIAHGADMLAEAAGHPAVDLSASEQCLPAVEACLFKTGYYTNEEDDRLIFVIEALLEGGLPDNKLQEWIVAIFEGLQGIHEREGFSSEFFRIKTNVLNFAKTLYFRLEFLDESPTAKKQITEGLKHWHRLLHPRKN
jgi:hypothetical protein